MTPDEVKWKIAHERDFINMKKYDYSLKKLLAAYPDGVPENIICSALGLQPSQVDKIYKNCVKKLKDLMMVDSDEE